MHAYKQSEDHTEWEWKLKSCGLVVSACNPDMLSCGARVGNAASNRTCVPILDELGTRQWWSCRKCRFEYGMQRVPVKSHQSLNYFMLGSTLLSDKTRQTLFPKKPWAVSIHVLNVLNFGAYVGDEGSNLASNVPQSCPVDL